MLRENSADFRFYGNLNVFFPAGQCQGTIHYRFHGHPAIKDPIEAQGVSHTEVELIIVNAQPVGFDYPLMDGDRVAVYPVFAKLDISPLLALLQ
jgi:hypothetical protein